MSLIPLLLIFVSILLWFLSQRAQQATGLPTGRVVYSDTGAWGRVEKPIFSPRLQLTGKPDYLVREGSAFIPVEVKSGRAPDTGAYASHIFQLAAYCVLVEEAYGRRPTHGLIKYADKVLGVDFSEALEAELLALLDDIRADAEAGDVSRSHNLTTRCWACGFRDRCEESLV